MLRQKKTSRFKTFGQNSTFSSCPSERYCQSIIFSEHTLISQKPLQQMTVSVEVGMLWNRPIIGSSNSSIDSKLYIKKLITHKWFSQLFCAPVRWQTSTSRLASVAKSRLTDLSPRVLVKTTSRAFSCFTLKMDIFLNPTSWAAKTW